MDFILSIICNFCHREYWQIVATYRKGACIETCCRRCGRVWTEAS